MILYSLLLIKLHGFVTAV